MTRKPTVGIRLTYSNLRDECKRKREAGESTDIIDDIVFEVELIKQIEINIDYILLLVKKREEELQTIISEEKLKPEDTRKFLENAFRDGEIMTSGTDIDELIVRKLIEKTTAKTIKSL